MDRSYLAEDTIRVFPTVAKRAELQEPIATFVAQPYRCRGFMNYEYQGEMFKGYECPKWGTVIFMDDPLFNKQGEPA